MVKWVNGRICCFGDGCSRICLFGVMWLKDFLMGTICDGCVVTHVIGWCDWPLLLWLVDESVD